MVEDVNVFTGERLAEVSRTDIDDVLSAVLDVNSQTITIPATILELDDGDTIKIPSTTLKINTKDVGVGGGVELPVTFEFVEFAEIEDIQSYNEELTKSVNNTENRINDLNKEVLILRDLIASEEQKLDEGQIEEMEEQIQIMTDEIEALKLSNEETKLTLKSTEQKLLSKENEIKSKEVTIQTLTQQMADITESETETNAILDATSRKLELLQKDKVELDAKLLFFEGMGAKSKRDRGELMEMTRTLEETKNQLKVVTSESEKLNRQLELLRKGKVSRDRNIKEISEKLLLAESDAFTQRELLKAEQKRLERQEEQNNEKITQLQQLLEQQKEVQRTNEERSKLLQSKLVEIETDFTKAQEENERLFRTTELQRAELESRALRAGMNITDYKELERTIEQVRLQNLGLTEKVQQELIEKEALKREHESARERIIRLDKEAEKLRQETKRLERVNEQDRTRITNEFQRRLNELDRERVSLVEALRRGEARITLLEAQLQQAAEIIRGIQTLPRGETKPQVEPSPVPTRRPLTIDTDTSGDTFTIPPTPSTKRRAGEQFKPLTPMPFKPLTSKATQVPTPSAVIEIKDDDDSSSSVVAMASDAPSKFSRMDGDTRLLNPEGRDPLLARARDAHDVRIGEVKELMKDTLGRLKRLSKEQIRTQARTEGILHLDGKTRGDLAAEILEKMYGDNPGFSDLLNEIDFNRFVFE